MTIVCGIDGSESAREAARAAAALAQLSGDELVLAHVQEALMVPLTPVMGATPVALANTEVLDADRKRVHAELERQGAELAQAARITVRHVIHTGLPDQELLSVVAGEKARLLVVGSHGRRSRTLWHLGSVADRLAQSSPVPLLVVRDPRPFERRAAGEGKLSVVLALGHGKPTRAAARIAQEWCRREGWELVEAHVYDPMLEARHLGLGESESPGVRARIEKHLAQDLPGRFGETTDVKARFVALPSQGQLAETLAEFAEETRADLLIVGTHAHGALRRRREGSVSHAVLPLVHTNVMVVPSTVERSGPRTVTRVKRVLVGTDLTPIGNRAVELAAGILPADGQLVLLHVDVPPQVPSGFIMGYHSVTTPEERAAKRDLARGELEKLGRDVCGDKVHVQVEVVEADDVPRAILEAADRHEPDLVCLGTHHYGRVASVLIGSVARTVARRSERPVLLVPSEGE
jgi:nucleotide-binding universal stress UspA family protein